MVSAAQSAFSNQLIKSLLRNVPSVDPAHVIAVGASELRNVYSGAELQGIIISYIEGIKVAFSLSIALAGVATICSLAVPWVSVKEKERRRLELSQPRWMILRASTEIFEFEVSSTSSSRALETKQFNR